MENFFSRYKNPLVLMAVLFIQIIALATQVKRPENARASGSGGTRLIRVWTVTAITPFERGLVATGHFFRDTWRNYIDLHNVRKQNRELQEEMARMRLEQARLRAGVEEAQRLRALLEFKERYIGKTVAAQVIGSSGSDLSHMISIDKGSSDGIKPEMAVITPDGIVGKVKDVFPLSSQVLMITDRSTGAGVILENSRLQCTALGSGQNDLQVKDIMSDEKIEVGEQAVTSGGDRIYPKGLPVGTVTSVGNDSEGGGPFLSVRIKPAANLNRLEEVLIVTHIAEQAPEPVPSEQRRASEFLSQKVPNAKSDDTAAKPATGSGSGSVNLNPSPKPPAPDSTGVNAKKTTPGGPTANPGGSAVKGNAPGSVTGGTATSNPAAATGKTVTGKTSNTKTGGTSGESGAAGTPGTPPGATGSPTPRPRPKPSATPQATPAETPQSTPPQANHGQPANGNAEKPPR
jgi:rod shape-determining protein MreC